jgi:hypothetical protein
VFYTVYISSDSFQNFLFNLHILISKFIIKVPFRKSIATILLSITLLGSVMDLHDFVKLPRLIEHFQQHQIKNASVSFVDFLNLHYGSEAERHDKEEHHEHEDLPFKSPDCTFAHTVTLIPVFDAPELSTLVCNVSYSNFYQSTFSFDYSQFIWQPPRA